MIAGVAVNTDATPWEAGASSRPHPISTEPVVAVFIERVGQHLAHPHLPVVFPFGF